MNTGRHTHRWFSRFTSLDIGFHVIVYTLKCLDISYACQGSLSVNPNKYRNWRIPRLSIVKTEPGIPSVAFPSGLHRVRNHYVVHNQDRSGHPVGSISCTTVKWHQVRGLYQGTLICASVDGSLRDNSLGRLDYSTSRLFGDVFVTIERVSC